MKAMNSFQWATWIFMVIGALNWGLIGVFRFDLVETVFGTTPVLARAVHVIIGASGLYWLVRTYSTR